MDVGAVGGWSWYDDVGGGYDRERVFAIGFKGRGKSKGKETLTITGRRVFCQGSALASKKTRAKAKGSK